jgi:hypothetical protein
MQNKPRGLLSDSERSAYFVAAYPIAAVYEHPQRDQPLVQRDRRVLEDCAELDGELPMAGLPLPAALRPEVVVLFMPARGALRPIGQRSEATVSMHTCSSAKYLIACWSVFGSSLHESQQSGSSSNILLPKITIDIVLRRS